MSLGREIPCDYAALPLFPYDAKTWSTAYDIVTSSLPIRSHRHVPMQPSAPIYLMLLCECQGFLFLKDFSSESLDSVISWALFLYRQATDFMKQPGAEGLRSKKRLHGLPPMAYEWQVGMWKLALLSTEEFQEVTMSIEASRKQFRERAFVSVVVKE